MIERLIRALQALAAPADAQLARDPDFAAKAGGLALDYDDALRLTLDCPQIRLDPEAREALETIGERLDVMSGETDAFWTEDALRGSAEWEAVRRLAREALRALGEPVDLPPPGDGVHVSD